MTTTAWTVVRPPRRWWRTLGLSFVEARPVVQLIFLLRFAGGAALAVLSGGSPSGGAVRGAVAWLLLTWSVYLVNGVADVTEDRANGSRRPIARGLLDPGAALRTAYALATAGLLLAATVAPTLVLLGAGQLALGWWYSMGRAPLKRRVSGTTASVVLAGLLTYLAGASSAEARPVPHLWVFPVAMALWMAVGALAKDLSDVPGDRLAGRRTLPIARGETWARRSVAAVALTVAIAFLISAQDAWAPVRIASWLTVAGAVVLTWLACGSGSQGGPARRRRPYRVFMTTQYLTHLALLGPVATCVWAQGHYVGGG
ncbi:UbiA family prenyltransferase [Micromonospora rubida]|uniref:UbiA family prenyltransferase n=1 Tax=Micromonospora rubida TaxID=2697657 RepID=UPI001376DC91|nr:UbiA family prenyltransferase [Micromonospora rubida]NBE83277.1 homogenitisate phytyltransferase [Micromonospora rubida]